MRTALRRSAPAGCIAPAASIAAASDGVRIVRGNGRFHPNTSRQQSATWRLRRARMRWWVNGVGVVKR